MSVDWIFSDIGFLSGDLLYIYNVGVLNCELYI